MSEYPHMLCALGVPARRCTSDCYFSGWCLGSIHEMSAKRPMGRCPITDPALDMRDIEGVIWRGEYFSGMPGDEPSSWCLDRLPTNATDARNPEETYFSAATHAALRCLSMKVHLEVTEKGNVRWVSCTDGATIAWATRPCDEGNVICRDHAQVCTISATSGSLLPMVPWDGEERLWSRTVSPASTEQGLPGASVPVAESIETGRGTPPKDVDTTAPQKHPLTEEKEVAPGATTATE
ncbi:surface protease GP63 [Trypanosoma cruzi]|nr:surface protease GP63 [Trypanosoma cruzi]